MNKVSIKLLCTIIIILNWWAVAVGMIKNPGFESNLDDWTIKNDEPNAVSLSKESYTGDFSVKISHKKSTSYSYIAQAVDVKPRTKYQASVSIRGEKIRLGDGGKGVRLFIGTYPQANGLTATTTFEGTFEWTRVFTPTFDTGNNNKIWVFVYLHKSSGDLWVDDVVLTSSLEDISKETLVLNSIINRIQQDSTILKKEINESTVSLNVKEGLINELTLLEESFSNITYDAGSDFKAIVPLNRIHTQVFKINAKFRKAQGFEEIIIWKNNRWDMLSPTALPPDDGNKIPELDIVMMLNEYRSEAFNITNNSLESLSINLKIEGLPGGTSPDYIKVHTVEFVDTREGVVIADALPLAKKVSDGFEIVVPAGLTRQVWFTFNPRDVEPGFYKGVISLKDERWMESMSIPLTFRLSEISFPDKPSISLTMWDYVDELRRDLPISVREQAIEDMREHFVDSPWGLRNTAPWPSSIDIREDEIKMLVDFSKFDKWILDWHGARNYILFLSVGNSFGPQKVQMNEPLFEKLVSYWACLWSKHVKEIGVDPSRISLLLRDEPRNETEFDIIIAWAKAIKKGAPEFIIWQDLTFLEPRDVSQELYEVCDVICPQVPVYYRAGEEAHMFYKELQDEGKILWFYECTGGRTFDPYYYHRLQQWRAWQAGAKGTGFWSYSDGGGTFPWNEYEAIPGAARSYTPIYFDNQTITTGKHWEAIREGVEDYEYLGMLSSKIEELEHKGAYEDEVLKAKRILIEAPERVLGTYDGTIRLWSFEKERNSADIERVRVLDALENLFKLDRHNK